ncbi:MAG: phosphoribosylglycinamide formyltransferase [Acidobacteria bacterium]|nr:phosphoribosylglycinamide formyltransferase [Acidobacteriota bacterium]
MGASGTSLGILISGRGSNMQALVSAVRAGTVAASVGVVVSNREDAPGLVWAREVGIATAVVPHGAYPTRAEYDEALVTVLQAHGVTLVCLAGFMRVLGPDLCRAFPSAILNIHPSLLPAFPGVNAQRQALEYGVRMTGVTVHFVTPELDAGPIVAQVTVPVNDTDTVESLSARMLIEEHRLFPLALQSVIQGGWRIEGRRVVFE